MTSKTKMFSPEHLDRNESTLSESSSDGDSHVDISPEELVREYTNRCTELEQKEADLKQEIATCQRKIHKYKEKVVPTEFKLKIAEERVTRLEKKMDVMEDEYRAKVAKLKVKLNERFTKDQKVKSLTDTIKLAVQQGKIELSGRKVSHNVLMRERLSRLANMMEDLFGGMVFIAPLDLPENSVLSTSTKKTGRKFLTYVWSRSGEQIVKHMGSDFDSAPMLERSPIFQYVIDSRQVFSPDLRLINLPKNHPPLGAALLVPVVVGGKALGLVGLGNGKYNHEDGEVLFEALPSAWLSVIESVKESSNMSVVSTLPSFVVERFLDLDQDESNAVSITSNGQVIADSYHMVTILFCNIVGFTKYSNTATAEEVVSLLNRFFTMIDGLVEDHGLEKIRTVGDCYMVAGGIPESKKDHAESVAEFAIELLERCSTFMIGTNPINVRIGMHSGPVIAGVIGKSKLAYDVWGETVNKARRMENTSLPNKIQVTDETYRLLKHLSYLNFEPRGTMRVSGIGEVLTYFLYKDEIPIITTYGSPQPKSPYSTPLPITVPSKVKPILPAMPKNKIFKI